MQLATLGEEAVQTNTMIATKLSKQNRKKLVLQFVAMCIALEPEHL